MSGFVSGLGVVIAPGVYDRVFLFTSVWLGKDKGEIEGGDRVDSWLLIAVGGEIWYGA